MNKKVLLGALIGASILIGGIIIARIDTFAPSQPPSQIPRETVAPSCNPCAPAPR